MKKIIKVFLSSAVFIFGTTFVNAAELGLAPSFEAFTVGREFQVDLVLGSVNENINALEGDMSFPGELLELKEIRDGDSIINFWIKRPTVASPEKSSGINFSGVIIGGYKGQSGKVFSMIFKTKTSGTGFIEVKNARAMLNDGKATQAQLDLKKFMVKVKNDASSKPSAVGVLPDNVPPETFYPIVSSDAKLFGGRLVLIFATQDKGSGIDRYEIKEGNQPFILARSPYVLSNQKADEPIIVRTFDKAGNARDAFYAPPKSSVGAAKTSVSNQPSFPWIGAFLVLAGLYIGIRLIRRHRV